MEKHPYISSKGPVIQIVKHLRNSFPSKLDAATIRKLGIASKNESYLISILRFVGFIDKDGKQTGAAKKTFSLHDDEAFHKSLATLIKIAYAELFNLHGNKAWSLDRDSLITFFRGHDQTGGVVGMRQAVTFEALSALCGYKELPEVRVSGGKSKIGKSGESVKKKVVGRNSKPQPTLQTAIGNPENNTGNIGLTVRVEINLPSDGSQETYDNIFKSIKENLLNG